MARLLVLRHGKTEVQSQSGRDFDRALVKRGIANSRDMAAQMTGAPPECILVSPAMRTIQTAEFLLSGLPTDAMPEPVEDERIYGGEAGLLWRIICEHGGDCASALIIGHNPGLAVLVEVMLKETDRGIGHFPTCGFAELEFAAAKLKEAQPGQGKLLRLLTPKGLGLTS